MFEACVYTHVSSINPLNCNFSPVPTFSEADQLNHLTQASSKTPNKKQTVEYINVLDDDCEVSTSENITWWNEKEQWDSKTKWEKNLQIKTKIFLLLKQFTWLFKFLTIANNYKVVKDTEQSRTGKNTIHEQSRDCSWIRWHAENKGKNERNVGGKIKQKNTTTIKGWFPSSRTCHVDTFSFVLFCTITKMLNSLYILFLFDFLSEPIRIHMETNLKTHNSFFVNVLQNQNFDSISSYF